jgi:thymidylate synthase
MNYIKKMVSQVYIDKLKGQNWPQEFHEKLHTENLQSNVGIATLWTFQEVVYKDLDPNKYAIIGNYYDRQNALEPLIRNCLANPNIRYIIIVGNDKAKSKEVLVNFFEKGFVNSLVIGTETKIPKEIPIEDLETLRKNVKIIDASQAIKNLDDPAEYARVIEEIIRTLEIKEPYAEPRLYPKPALETDSFPAESAGFIIRGKTVGETWLKVLKNIYDYGKITKMKTGDSTSVRECIDLITVIEDEDPDKPKMEPYFRFDEHYLKEYYNEICSPNIPQGMIYTYGSRFRAWESKNGEKIDQIADMIEYLKKDTYRKSALAQTWIVEDELTRRYLNKDKNSPCVILVQPNIQDGVLHLTVYVRSNDMFRAWPLNVFGFRKLQKIIAEGLSVDMGSLITISCSAHIYQDNWNETKELLKKYEKPANCFFDQRGYYIIQIDEGKIKVKHYSPNSHLLKIYFGTSAREINDSINSSQHSIDSYHSSYLGEELMKAEIALKLGIEYSQDRPLNFDSIKKESDSIKNKFIVFEGIDGCGKSTQFELLAKYLFSLDKHIHLIMTREPYKNLEIREILRSDSNPLTRADKLAELFIEDRKKHVEEVIEPSLKNGLFVLSDRYKLSTIAYQSTQGLLMEDLIKKHSGLNIPDATFIIDVPAEVAAERMQKEKGRIGHKFEANKEFLEKTRRQFLKAKEMLKDEKIFVLDGTKTKEDVFSEVKKIVDEIIHSRI